MSNKIAIGLAAISGWCIFSAMARVLTTDVTQHIDPVTFCFYSFIFSSVVFLILNYKNPKNTLKKITSPENKSTFTWLNITTLGAWFFLIIPLKYIEPALVSTITLGLSPIATLTLGTLIYQNKRAHLHDLVISVLLTMVILFTIFLCFSGEGMLEKVSTPNLLFLIACCVIVGFASAATNLFAKKLSDNQFSPIEILSIRFLFTVLLSGVICFSQKKSIIIPLDDLATIISTSLCLVIIPLYLAQISIKYLKPIEVAIVTPLMPVFVIIFESFNHHMLLTSNTVLVTFATTILVLSGVFIQLLKQKKIQIESALPNET